MTAPYDWLRVLKPELIQLDGIPLTSSPPFPWNDLGNRLQSLFNKNAFNLSASTTRWLYGNELFDGLGKNPFVLSFSLLPLEGTAHWLMPKEAIKILKKSLLTYDNTSIDWPNSVFDESFCRFLALETLNQISEIVSFPSLTPILNEEKNISETEVLCLDLTVSIDQLSFTGRIAISPTLRKAWTQYIDEKGLKSINQALAQKIEALLHIEAGSTELSLQDWHHLKEGDFLVLDQCTLDDDNYEGRVMLTASGHPIFRAKIKGGNVKILEFPFYHKVGSDMSNEPEDEEQSSFETNESSLPEEEVKGDEELPEQEENDTEKTPSATKAKSAKPIPPQEIPVSVVIELGRIQITVAKLLELEPGNYLDLDIKPEEGVDLVVNGKVVGKGELVKLGETLGVRIVELG